VTDFGIARAAEATTISKPGDILGSAKYMSPEQAAGGRVGPPSDLYSLGMVLYEMLTGSVPFAVATPADVPAQHAKGPPRRPSEANPEVPEALDGLVLRLLSTSPEDRYGSSAELLGELGRVKNWLPPTATSPHEATTAALGGPIAPAPDPSTSAPRAPAGPGGARSRRAWWIIAAFVALIAVLASQAGCCCGYRRGRHAGTRGGGARGAARGRVGRGRPLKRSEVPAVDRPWRRRRRASASQRTVSMSGSGTGRAPRERRQGPRAVGSGRRGATRDRRSPHGRRRPGSRADTEPGRLTYPEAENELEQAASSGGVKEAPSGPCPPA
jgi:hypothetical protein